MEEKTKFWSNLALNHLEEMRFLGKTGLLDSYPLGDKPLRPGWENIAEHSLVQIAAVRTLGELLGLEEEQIGQLEKAAAWHDVLVRFNKRPEDFSEDEKEDVRGLIARMDSEVTEIIAATSGFSNLNRILVEKRELPWLAKILWYVDNITMGSEIVPLEQRIQEARRRRIDLDENQEISTILSRALGEKTSYWDVELRLSKEVGQEIFEKLRQRGVEIENPENIPSLIKSEIENSYQGK